MLTVQTLQSIHTESNFDLFWEKVDKLRSSVTVSNPCLPRKCRVPKRYDMEIGQAEFHSTAKACIGKFTLKFLTWLYLP